MGVFTNILIWSVSRRFFGEAVAACAALLALLCGLLMYYELILLREAAIVFAGLALTWLIDRAFTARGESLASHRDGRGASRARRDDREYAEYLREEQRSPRGYIARRMQPGFHHGLFTRGRWTGFAALGVSLGFAMTLKSTFVLAALAVGIAIVARYRHDRQALVAAAGATAVGLLMAATPAIARTWPPARGARAGQLGSAHVSLFQRRQLPGRFRLRHRRPADGAGDGRDRQPMGPDGRPHVSSALALGSAWSRRRSPDGDCGAVDRAGGEAPAVQRARAIGVAVRFAIGHALLLSLGAGALIILGWSLPLVVERGGEMLGGILLIVFGARAVERGCRPRLRPRHAHGRRAGAALSPARRAARSSPAAIGALAPADDRRRGVRDQQPARADAAGAVRQRARSAHRCRCCWC